MNNKGYGRKGWEFLIYCILAFYVATAFKDSMNVAVMTFEEKMGWDRTYLLSLASIGAYVTCAVTYVLGLLNAAGKLSARVIALGTGLLYAVTISLWGVIPSLSLFTFNYVIMTIGYTIWTQFANNTMIANWFPKKNGAVIGIATIGFPLAAATNSLLFSKLSEVVSFSNIYFIFGVTTLVLTIYGFIRFKDNPEESGFYPDNDKSMTKESVEEIHKREAEIAKNSPWTPKRMLKLKETWIIGICSGLMILVASGSMGQMVPRFMSGGMELQLAVRMMTIVGASAMVGSWLIGKLDYKFGVKKIFVITIALLAVACGVYAINSLPAMMAGAIIIGVALGGATNFIVSLVAHYWGRNNFKKAYGTIFTIATLVGSSGAILVANLSKAMSYTVAYLVIAVIIAISFFPALSLKEGFVETNEKKFAKEDKK